MKLLLPILIATSLSAFAGDFAGTAGLQLFSFREAFKTDVPGTLDKVKALGFTEVETSNLYGMPPEKLVEMLKARGLTPVSGHFPYGALKKDVAAQVAEAKALGVKFAACAWIPHDAETFGEAEVKRAAADFNAWGEAFAAQGVRFCYHPHGYEFQPVTEGASETSFDRLVAETRPEFVNFEMDVFWVVLPGADPVKLLEKYPGRFLLMHMKDLRKGAPTGIHTGHAEKTDDVAIGTGQVDWPAVFRAAAKSGVKHYFIEDESPIVEEQIPRSLKYLESLK